MINFNLKDKPSYMPKTRTDSWYLKGIQESSQEVISAIIADFFPMVRDYVLKNSGTIEDAEDIFSDTLEAIYRNVHQKGLTLSCKFSTYLYAVAQKIWLKTLRSKKHDSQVTIDDPALFNEVQKLDESLEKTEEYKLMREKFELLPEDCQKILELSWSTDLSGKEISKQMGLTHGYLRKRKHLCKEKLMDLVKSDIRFLELKKL